MRPRIVSACVAIALLALPVLADAKKPAGVDVNGGFENGSGPIPANWITSDGRPALRAAMDDAPEGEHVLLYVGDVAAIRSISFGYDEGEELVVSALVRDMSIPVEIGVEFFRHGASLGQQTLGPRSPSVAWEMMTVHAFSPLGTTRATILIKGTPATLSFVDDITIAD